LLVCSCWGAAEATKQSAPMARIRRVTTIPQCPRNMEHARSMGHASVDPGIPRTRRPENACRSATAEEHRSRPRPPGGGKGPPGLVLGRLVQLRPHCRQQHQEGEPVRSGPSGRALFFGQSDNFPSASDPCRGLGVAGGGPVPANCLAQGARPGGPAIP
jgi:hypothetical protein